jgi:CDP-glucose 4,6-dehydratase
MTVQPSGGLSASASAASCAPGIDERFWHGRRVLLTGHTGFKGGWLALWLQSMGGRVGGLSCGVPTQPSLYELARVGEGMTDEISADVRDFVAVKKALTSVDPEIVIHMAAQPLVRRSFAEPRMTFETNVMGTVNVLEAVRETPGVRVAVIVTSDKCYENRGWEWGYREDEPMGGHDPYSSSKGAAELVTAAYRRSFFAAEEATRLASARAGNVIGGGDWGEDRLVPDLARAVFEGDTLYIRNPDAVRPWQHVINPLSGYLLLAQQLWSSPALAGGWNFGPDEDDARRVSWIVEQLGERWSGRPRWERQPGSHLHEAQYLKLDSSRARARLGWRPLVSIDAALDSIVEWYEALSAGADMRAVTLTQIDQLAASSPRTR